MSSDKILIYIFSTLLCLCSCSDDNSQNLVTSWGKEEFYEDFMWKKYVPDTLYRQIAFDFNDDAKNYMTEPLQLGLFKKTDSGKMVPVLDNEMEVFANGVKCPDNIISVSPDTETVLVGIVFNPKAENKVHHWFFKPVNDGGAERINDMDPEMFNSPNSSLLELEVEKNKIMNPLAVGTLAFGIILISALLIWLLLLKFIFYPTFKVGKIMLCDPVPYMCQKSLRGCRKLVLTKNKSSQSFLNRLFTGRVIYDVNSMWTSDIVIIPRDRKSVKAITTAEYMMDSKIMKIHNDYTICNTATGTKTKVTIF